MSDMWAAASKDIEAEHKERGTAMAAVALGNFAPFLFEAKSRGDFNTRVALQQERIAAALVEATEIEECRKEALDQMTADFDQVLATRRKAAEHKATAKAAVAKAVKKAVGTSEVVYSTDGARVVDLGEGNPIAPRYKIEKDFGDGAFGFVSFSDDLDAAKAAADGQQKVATKVARKRPTDKTASGERTITCRTCGEPYRGDWSVVRCYCPLDAGGERATVSPTWAAHGYISGDEVIRITDSGLLVAVKPGAATMASLRRRTAADEISAGDYIVAKGGLPDLRDGQSHKVMLTTNRPGKVTKIETFDEAFPKGFQRYDWIDAKEKFERFLGTWDDSSFDLDNHGDDVWVAHLDSGEIVPLDAARHYSDRFPTRSNGPQVPGQKSWNLASRQEAERLPMRIRMAAQAEERLPMQIHMANPYSNGNPYSNTNPPAAAPAPQVTVNVAPPEDKPVVDDDDERQRRTRDKINQTQMTQDLTASQRTLQTTLARKIKRQYPHVTAQQAMKVAKATMEAHPGLVHHAVSRLPQGGRETSTKESSSR